jgi:hypothetical protein
MFRVYNIETDGGEIIFLKLYLSQTQQYKSDGMTKNMA